MEERNCPMEDPFAFLTLNFLKKSEIFPGSLGTFRYRFQRTGKVNDGTVQAWVYENICFEKAQHIETETFPWTGGHGIPALLAERAPAGTGKRALPGLGRPIKNNSIL